MDTLVLIDVLDSHGMMLSRQRHVLQYPGAPLLIGRDLACDVVVSDPYSAPRHAALSLQENGALRIEDLGTINGLIVGEERVRQAMITGLAGAQVQVGHSHLRIRTSADTLAPERPDRESLRSRHREYTLAACGALVCAGLAGLTAWIDAPDRVQGALADNLLRGGGVLLLWFALWVILSRVVRSRWQWSAHGAITLGAAALILGLWWGTDVVIFASGIAGFQLRGMALIVIVLALAVYLHLRTATRFTRRRAAVLATVLPAMACAGYLWFQQQYEPSAGQIPPPGRIFPPSWSRQPGVRLDKFLEESLDLRDAANQYRGE